MDECESAAACEADRRCVNTAGSFRCDCLPGYRASGLGRQCTGEAGGWGLQVWEAFSETVSCLLPDINECLEGDLCFSGGECLNTPGSYVCMCSQGFTLSSNGTACMGESAQTQCYSSILLYSVSFMSQQDSSQQSPKDIVIKHKQQLDVPALRPPSLN